MVCMLEGSNGLIIFRRAWGSRLGYPWPLSRAALPADSKLQAVICFKPPYSVSAGSHIDPPPRRGLPPLLLLLVSRAGSETPLTRLPPPSQRTAAAAREPLYCL